ncbi:peptidoglycan/xylan/chitin deacetylase (PgdA/CDA1 family) [Actinoplanes campanulatus]|uniref:Peptidoglycan/xylan/chitin deacetylase (PgdA/CDA1 family) n=1 Tax=Actinoplanes campanulatus TaxID=113559 RepID=A0A7W5AT39_9ACTN|nr:polysaccharide deacetylase family protein [Actinoplanes campanulatus]MBB3101504.1 peptidoglycan/xylan/chitin deacetylase (PgdA/CDA1 family) [Actinoplanes campanulatus]
MSTSARAALRTAVIALTVPALAVIGGIAARPAAAADTMPYRAQVFTQGYDTGKVATLTFDLDWRTGTATENAASKANLETVLRVFAGNGITGGFGVTGRFAAQNPGEARNIADQGHKIFNHSYSHPDFMTLTQAQRWSQLDRTEAAFRAAGIASAGWFRAPYRSGYMNAGLNRDLALRGFYINADWTFDTTGYQAADWTTVSARIDRYLKPGAIIVMHVTTPSTDPGNLQRIIDKIKGMGYAFVSPFQAVTRGPIRAVYLAAGGPSSLGAATTGPMQASTAGTEVQWFQKGRLYHSTATGAHAVRGAILTKYRAMGTVGSFLRYPVTDEQPGAGGGWHSTFQGGSIYWSSATGAHEVHGAIRTKWLALGGEAGYLGYPRSDEKVVSVGRAVQFQRGNVYWNSRDGAHVVGGAILTRYLALGGTGSRLGPPTSDEYTVATGRRSDFRNGSLIWNRTTNTVTVVYR